MQYAKVMWRRNKRDRFDKINRCGPEIGEHASGAWNKWVRENCPDLVGQVALVTDVSIYVYAVEPQAPPVKVERA